MQEERRRLVRDQIRGPADLGQAQRRFLHRLAVVVQRLAVGGLDGDVPAVHRDHAGLLRHVAELEHDVVQRIRAELVLAGIEEVQARDGEPAVVRQQHLFALGMERVERRYVVSALRGSHGGHQGQQQQADSSSCRE